MNIAVLIIFIILLAIAGILLIIWGGKDRVLEAFVGGIVLFGLSIIGIVWAIDSYVQPWEAATTEYYTPVTVVFEDGAKVQLIMVKGEIINVHHLFHSIIPDDKVIKRVQWKDTYSYVSYLASDRPMYFVVAKSEKQ
jgi:ABC-type polysaccharide/polyol phosphate export permease